MFRFELFIYQKVNWKFSTLSHPIFPLQIIRIATVVYLHHIGARGILDQRKTQHFTYDPDDPMQSIKVLGLNLGKMNKQNINIKTHIHSFNALHAFASHNRTCKTIFSLFSFLCYFFPLLLPTHYFFSQFYIELHLHVVFYSNTHYIIDKIKPCLNSFKV